MDKRTGCIGSTENVSHEEGDRIKITKLIMARNKVIL
jgi:hypothetical protein